MPTARPSKTEWVPSPINNTKGVILATHDGLESSTVLVVMGAILSL